MYTSIGPVLIAVNPYKQLSMGGEGIYSSGVRDYYHRKVNVCAGGGPICSVCSARSHRRIRERGACCVGSKWRKFRAPIFTSDRGRCMTTQ